MDRALATRHVMQANKSANTGPELAVRSYLRSVGLSGYRLHWKKAPGRPDICYPGRHVAIFVNGCYWHRCPRCALPSPRTNIEFWSDKFARNRARDERNHEDLRAAGWTVVVVWECQLKGERREGSLAEIAAVVRGAEAHVGTGVSPVAERDARGRFVSRREGSIREVGTGKPWRLARSRRRLSLARTR